jgi:phosphatidate cytidylyltransferase
MKTRAISAIVAVLLLLFIYFMWARLGLMGICIFSAVMMIFEYSRLAFRRFHPPEHLLLSFLLLCAAVFGTTFLLQPAIALATMSVAAVVFCAMSLLTIRRSDDLPAVLQIQALALFGFFYCGIFPAFASRLMILDRAKGHVWFLGLLAIVFSGDTGAYLAGRTFGRRKLLEPVSPKKTVEGSIGGLIGSTVAGAVLSVFFLPEQPLGVLLCMAFVTGAFAQVGDLVESLIKRVADVKDSGSIMPGHGGVLDRLDGLIFAAPVYYALVSFLV